MAETVTVDARGLTCPQPVLETKKALEEGRPTELLVLVDNPTAKENVARFARNQGCEVEVRESAEGQFLIRVVSKASGAATTEEELLPCTVPEASSDGRIVVFVGNNCMGRGDDALGEKLMRGFLRTWLDVELLPWRMIFVNAGVRLTTIDDEAVDAVALLEEKGVEILSCGTCLRHFGYEDRLRVGKATNMFEVVDSLRIAGKVVSPD